jgi:thymidylate kinase
MRKTFTVALIGGDGAGKTSVARRLLAKLPIRMKYIYMGIGTASSKFSLPTSRLVHFLKTRGDRNQRGEASALESAQSPCTPYEYGRTSRGPVWMMLRTANRLAEAWYRLIFVVIYRMQGYSLIFDRYFVFDAALGNVYDVGAKRKLADEIYYWALKIFYPKPNLVIFLDAPPEALFARKQEAPIEYLSRCREVYRNEGKYMKSFITVDVTQSIDKVVQEVENHILAFSKSKGVGKYAGKHWNRAK